MNAPSFTFPKHSFAKPDYALQRLRIHNNIEEIFLIASTLRLNLRNPPSIALIYRATVNYELGSFHIELNSVHSQTEQTSLFKRKN